MANFLNTIITYILYIKKSKLNEIILHLNNLSLLFNLNKSAG